MVKSHVLVCWYESATWILETARRRVFLEEFSPPKLLPNCLRERKWRSHLDRNACQRWQNLEGEDWAFYLWGHPTPPFSSHPTSDSLCRPRASGRVHAQLLKREIQPERANLPSLFLKFQQVPKMFRKNTDFISDSSEHWRVIHMTQWGGQAGAAPRLRATHRSNSVSAVLVLGEP